MKRWALLGIFGLAVLAIARLWLPPLLNSVYHVAAWTPAGGFASASATDDEYNVTIVPRRGSYRRQVLLQITKGSLFLGDKLVREEEAVAVVRQLSRDRPGVTLVIMAGSSERFGSIAHWAEVLKRARVHRIVIMYDQEPNQALEPTPPSVTIRADARLAPAGVVAHL